MSELLREGNPPSGFLASPIPQYRKSTVPLKVNAENESVQGENGAMYVKDRDAIAILNLINQTTLAAVLAKLLNLETELAAIKANQISGNQKVLLNGNNMEYYGATIANRPSVNTVPVGAFYMAVNTKEIWQSNGTDWVVR